MGCEQNTHNIGVLQDGAKCPCGFVEVHADGQGALRLYYCGSNATISWRVQAPTPLSWSDGTSEPAIAPAIDDHVDAMMDLARNGREQDFRDLALMVGINAKELDALWSGTLRRLGQ